MKQPENIIPAQKKGTKTGATSRVDAATRHDAINLFKESKTRLLDINNWHRLCGKGSAVFQITDEQGLPLNANKPIIGNLVRIELPAPPNNSGNGYDWVRLEKFETEKNLLKDEEIFGFTVRPVANPLDAAKESAHFYTNAATSTFLVMRNANSVLAMERGRNKKPNIKAGSLLTKLRNIVVAIAAMIGFATPQWKSLVKGIIRKPVLNDSLNISSS